MTSISANLQAVRARIGAAATAAGRRPDEIRLLAVSKSWSADLVRKVAAEGQTAFGESYVQEGVEKCAALRDMSLEWHFIGPIQSNKTRLVTADFAWVHSLDRFRIAQRLSAQRDPTQAPLNVCIQVNVSGETSKSGVAPGEVRELAAALVSLPNLRLRGLMCIPEPDAAADVLRSRFRTLRNLRDELNDGGLALDTLSMGMSDDLEIAIAEGSTMVRVGSAIFGARTRQAGGRG